MILNYDDTKFSGPVTDHKGTAYVFSKDENYRWADAHDEAIFICNMLLVNGEIDKTSLPVKIKKKELTEYLVPLIKISK